LDKKEIIMKKKSGIFSMLLIMVFVCTACAQKYKTIYDYGFGAIYKSHRGYKKDPRFNVSKPIPCDKILKECGYGHSIDVSNDSIHINYVKSFLGETLTSVSMSKKNNFHPLGKYIGTSFDDFCKIFPLEENENNSTSTFFYLSDKNEKFDIKILCTAGIIDSIQIQNKDFKKKYKKALAKIRRGKK